VQIGRASLRRQAVTARTYEMSGEIESTRQGLQRTVHSSCGRSFEAWPVIAGSGPHKGCA